MSSTSDTILKKIGDMEKILIEINSKIDNFLGLEELTPHEKKELDEIKKEVKDGEYKEFEEVFDS
jgi:hypothetical protein